MKKLNNQPKEASKYTQDYQRKFADALGIDITNAANSELELAQSHNISKTRDKKIYNKEGKEIWNLENYEFLKEEAVPDTINPSLWLNAKSNFRAGLFWVVKDKIFQVRGFDLANITFVRSRTGFIVLDTGTLVESARAALAFAEQGIGENIRDHIRAVIISHSHADHYGGVAETA